MKVARQTAEVDGLQTMCSTPFGINEGGTAYGLGVTGTRPRAQRLSASMKVAQLNAEYAEIARKVLNAFRHQ